MKNKTNIMVTGCAGFIGSHFTDLLSKKYNVVGIDLMTYAAKKENMSQFQDKITFYKADIADFNTIERIVKDHKIDWIINFAAETHVDNSINSSEKFLRSNIAGVHSLLEVCRLHNCGIFQISTDEVYGSIKDGSFVESDKLNPRNPYSATKAAAEHLITSYNNTYGVTYKMVRMSNNFGPRQNKEKFIPTILRSLGENKKIPVYGDGKNIRDWFYVKDCAKCILSVFENDFVNETYNLTLVNEKENIEVVDTILRILQKNLADHVEFVRDRLGHDFRYSIDNNKFINNIGVVSETDFTKAITETIEYYEKQ